jgi:hypothetical protein
VRSRPPAQRCNDSRAGAIREPWGFVGCEAVEQFLPWDAFAAIQLGQPAADLSLDDFFVCPQPDLALGCTSKSVGDYVVGALKRAAAGAALYPQGG